MKLNLKKKDAAGGGGGGGEKKAKKKARSGGGDGLVKAKTFFAEHVEKLLLGAIAVVSLYLVYAGFSKETIANDPASVEREIANAKASMNASTWAEVKQERLPEPDTFDEQATLDSIAIDAASYKLQSPFHPRLQERGRLRTDPELLAPFDLEVKAGYGPVSVRQPAGAGSELAGMANRSDPNLRTVPDNPFRQSAGRGDRSSSGTYKERFFAVVTGLVPVKKQFDVYQETFKGAAEYDMERDVPRYLGLMLERAEVGPDGSVGEWQEIDTRAGLMEARRGDAAQELADPQYLLPALVMSLPVVALRDVTPWAVHSSVPIVQETTGRMEAGGPREGRREGGMREEHREGRREGADAGGPADAGPGGWFDLADPSMSRGEGGGEVRTGSGTRRTEPSYATGDGNYTEEAKPPLDVDNGMLRYFDFTVKPGVAYRYRARLVLEDPNDPAASDARKPTPASCEPDVLVRLQSDNTPSFELTDWSDPSGTVRVPSGSMFLASEVEWPREVEVGPGRVSMMRGLGEPTANVMVLDWNSRYAMDVPVLVEAQRGAVLNGAVEAAEAVDPAVNQLRKLENYRYSTDAIVVDMYGGFDVARDLKAPGFVLVMTDDGRMEVRKSTTDYRDVQSNIFEPEEDNIADRGFEGEDAGGEEGRGRGGRRAGGRGEGGRGEGGRGETGPFEGGRGEGGRGEGGGRNRGRGGR